MLGLGPTFIFRSNILDYLEKNLNPEISNSENLKLLLAFYKKNVKGFEFLPKGEHHIRYKDRFPYTHIIKLIKLHGGEVPQFDVKKPEKKISAEQLKKSKEIENKLKNGNLESMDLVRVINSIQNGDSVSFEILKKIYNKNKQNNTIKIYVIRALGNGCQSKKAYNFLKTYLSKPIKSNVDLSDFGNYEAMCRSDAVIALAQIAQRLNMKEEVIKFFENLLNKNKNNEYERVIDTLKYAIRGGHFMREYPVYVPINPEIEKEELEILKRETEMMEYNSKLWQQRKKRNIEKYKNKHKN
jgi:hypothetical protein